MSARSVLGFEGKLYRNTGTYEAPDWEEMPNVKDVKVGFTKGEADVTTRASGGYKAQRGALIDLMISFTMIWDPEDEDSTAIRDSFLNRTAVEFLGLDGAVDVSGNQGPRATFEVFKFERDESLEKAMETAVEIKPTYADNPPAWYTVP
jgi:hypothetical protein